jgi:hypothetical protein
MNVKSLNNFSKWQMRINSAFKGLNNAIKNARNSRRKRACLLCNMNDEFRCKHIWIRSCKSALRPLYTALLQNKNYYKTFMYTSWNSCDIRIEPKGGTHPFNVNATKSLDIPGQN